MIDFGQNSMVFNGSGSTVQILENVKFGRSMNDEKKIIETKLVYTSHISYEPLFHR